MDNNPLPTSTQPQVMPSMPAVTPEAVSQGPGGSKKMVMIILLVFLAVALLLGGGVFMYMRAQNSKIQESPETAQSTQVLNNLSTDINNVDIATPGAEFSTVDGELNSL